MGNLLDALLPGNRRILVNGVAPSQGRDTVEISCLGATVADDPGRQLTRIGLPASGSGPDEWTAFSPLLFSAGGGFSLGNGSSAAFWRRTSSDNVEITFQMTVGSTTNFGSGAFQLDFGSTLYTLDVAKLPNGEITSASVDLRDASTPANNRGGTIDIDDDTTIMILPYGVAGNLSGTVPFTWAAGDTIKFAVAFAAKPAEV